MRLSLLYEETNLAHIGSLIAHIASKEKIAQYRGKSQHLARFLRWVIKPDPRTWDDAIANNVARFAKELHQSGDEATKQDAMKWSQLATMPGMTVVAAMAATPDSVARDSVTDEVDMQDGLSDPIRSQLGDQSFGILAATLGKNRALRDRVFNAIHGQLGNMVPR